MVRIKPFCGFRPKSEYAQKVAALPYDVVNIDEAKGLVKDNPYSFLNVDKYEVHLKPNSMKCDIFQGANEYLKKLIAEGVFVLDQEEGVYIYQLESDFGVHFGLITCLYCDDYNKGVIKRHERVREEKKKDLVSFIHSSCYQSAPIMAIHKYNKEIENWILKNCKKEHLLYDLIDEKGYKHLIYKIKDRSELDNIKLLFEKEDVVYLADGHHRADSFAKYSKFKKETDENYDENCGYNYLLTVLFGKEQMVLRSYNRVIKDVSGLSKEELFDKLKVKFKICPTFDQEYKPNRKNIIGMRYQKKWYSLVLKEDEKGKLDLVGSLDVNVLQDFILAPIFKITDPTRNINIKFIGANKGIKELNKQTEQKYDIAFSLYETSIDDFIGIINNGQLMPPKSTWFEPKIRRGLFVLNMK